MSECPVVFINHFVPQLEGELESMSIISCTGCGKKISTLSPVCPHCGHQSGEVSDEKRAVLQFRKIRDRIYKLNMYSYAVISLFLVAFAWYWWDTAGFEYASSAGPYYLMGLSAVGYIAIRVLLFKAKQEKKQLQ